ncbi:MAG: fructose-1,6-bisphosphatase [Eubacteriales bacterium]
MDDLKNIDVFQMMLQKQFPNKASACSEIINLKAILNLPKPTEHFISDIHGEHEAFMHMIKNCSGVIKDKINQEFAASLSPDEKERLAICITYPEETIHLMKEKENNLESWYVRTIQQLIIICRVVSRKYTRSKVRKALPAEHRYIIEELLHETEHGGNKNEYYQSIVDSIVSVGTAESFIISICKVIQRLAIDKLHVVGDIFDRGPGPHFIIDEMMKYHSVDIQWGNHDIVWMGAYCGSEICIANIIRVCARYGHLDILEEGYGINLRHLSTLANSLYADDECICFKTVLSGDVSDQEKMLLRRMHKAMAVIQFKLEGQLIQRSPMLEMDGRGLLGRLSDDKTAVEVDGKIHSMLDSNLPTVDVNDPYELTEAEESLMCGLKKLFLYNEKMTKHMEFLLKKGGMYLKYNSNLLIHGCIPMNKDGSFAKVSFFGEELSGIHAMDAYENWVRECFCNRMQNDNNTDLFWYLWSGKNSPLFGKTEMKTFERYFIEDKQTHKEEINPYYSFWQDEDVIDRILEDFGLDKEFSHIINGHMPVRAIEGENPIKAKGKLIVIDGGLNPIYNPVTGTAGYTLIFNSYGLTLAAHERFESKTKIIDESKDIMTYYASFDSRKNRIRVQDTDEGKKIQMEIHALEELCRLYSIGKIKEL